jgi:dTDP-4-dehydrorhamnose reductase
VTRVLVTGANGLLGGVLVPTLRNRGHVVLRQSRVDGAELVVDLANPVATERALDAARPEVVVNLAAMTDVEQCEREPQRAFAANATVVRNLTRWIMRSAGACRLVQLSTDQVYDGPGPHNEEHVSPANYYALSKYVGELEAAPAGATVLRTNLFGRSRSQGRRSFSDWVVWACRRREAIKVFEDVWFSPLSLETLSELLVTVVEQPHPGTFNVGSTCGMSKADFAFAVVNVLGLSAELVARANSTEMAVMAQRPKDMRLDSARFESAFAIKLPSLAREINLLKGLYEQ